jgi:hypothetical protein
MNRLVARYFGKSMRKASGRSLFVLVVLLAFAGLAQDLKTSDTRALVYVYRYKQALGMAIRPSIYCDDAEVARMQNGRYLELALRPGTHAFRSNDKQSRIELDLKAGQRYFIRVDLATGVMKAHGRLVLMQAEQGGSEYKQLKPVDKGMVKDPALLASDFVPE